MKKKTVIILLLLFVGLIWLLLTAECVVGRANAGTPVDWANIKDCGY